MDFQEKLLSFSVNRECKKCAEEIAECYDVLCPKFFFPTTTIRKTGVSKIIFTNAWKENEMLGVLENVKKVSCHIRIRCNQGKQRARKVEKLTISFDGRQTDSSKLNSWAVCSSEDEI